MLDLNEKLSPSTLEVLAATSAEPSGSCFALSTAQIQKGGRMLKRKVISTKRFRRTSSSTISKVAKWSPEVFSQTWSLSHISTPSVFEKSTEAPLTTSELDPQGIFSIRNSCYLTSTRHSRSVPDTTVTSQKRLLTACERSPSSVSQCKASCFITLSAEERDLVSLPFFLRDLLTNMSANQSQHSPFTHQITLTNFLTPSLSLTTQ